MQSFSGNLHPGKGAQMLVKRHTVDGESVEINVDSDGRFSANFDDENYSAKTLEEVEALLKKAETKKRSQRAVDVSVINLTTRRKTPHDYSSEPYQKGRGVVHAKLRKRHDRQSRFLLTADDGTRFSVGTYGAEMHDICRRLTLEEVLRYEQLAKDVDDAEAALEAFRISVSVDANELMGPKERR